MQLVSVRQVAAATIACRDCQIELRDGHPAWEGSSGIHRPDEGARAHGGQATLGFFHGARLVRRQARLFHGAVMKLGANTKA